MLLGMVSALPGMAANATKASLELSAEEARPGETVVAGVRLTMDAGWHTYWRYGGDSGKPTEIEWKLPAGWKAGQIQWPAPEKHTVEGLTTYVLQGEVVLLTSLTLPADAAAGEQEITARVSWLECEVNCVPGQSEVRARLRVGSQSKPSAAADELKKALARIPKPEPRLQARAWWDGPAKANERTLTLEWTPTQAGAEEDFFPYESDKFEVGASTERSSGDGARIRLRKTVSATGGNWPGEIPGLVVEKRGEAALTAYEAKLAIQAAATSPAPPPTPGGQPAAAPSQGAAPAKTGMSLGWMFALAFLGGLILNIMPCVLPVIALKILGFVNQSKESPGRIRQLGIVYALGVLFSFLVLAGMVIGVQQAGRQASWGMQFGNPEFVVLLTILVTLVALNLFGLFEVSLGGRALTTASELAGREGLGGAFLNGVLATALATPCTAPFLGAALGFAFSQPPFIVVLVFLTVGAGLALPYLLLSWYPAWLKALPKPGAWMEKFKIAMGFPMLGTAVWLSSVAQAHYGRRVWWLGMFLVLAALAAWVFGAFVQQGSKRRGLAAGVAALILGGGYFYVLEGQLRWRAPQAEASAGVLQTEPGGIAWQPWSPEAVAAARARGRPVFVDFTADWCVTCQANKKTSIEIESVRTRLKEIDAAALLGDYTKVPPAITAELNRFGRAGVPLVLVYPRNSNAPPIVLPELLTPGKVLDALNEAAK